MVTGSWNYSQVTAHVHGQEVLSEETVHPGAEPESPSELQDRAQTLTPEEPHVEITQSPDPGAPAEQSLCHELELQPLHESGANPWRSVGVEGGVDFCTGEAEELGIGVTHRTGCREETVLARVPVTRAELREQCSWTFS